MSTIALDAFGRLAANAINRRGSLLTLGGAALAATRARPLSADAKKGKNKANKKCKRQVGQCTTALQVLCDDNDTDPVVCAATIACCKRSLNSARLGRWVSASY